MLKEKWMKHVVAGFACLVALITYALTMAPTVSFWDCGEFVACANTLGIPHPPGTPFFVFFARAAIVLLPFVDEIAKRVNYISVVSSAATVYVTALFAWELFAMVLDSTKTTVARNGSVVVDKLADKINGMGNIRTIVLGTAALVAGFLLTFSDTFWFNAVEAEVYGLAMFIVMLISYLGLVWYKNRDDEGSDRILVFICYIAFLGVGAHLYTMLTIPAVFVLLLVAQPKKILERFPIWITGVLLCSVIYMVSAFIKISLACFLILGLTWLAMKFSKGVDKRLYRSISLSLAFTVFALIGYSTHLYIPIRSELNPIIDENDPEINIRDEQGNLHLDNLLNGKNWEAFNNFVERKQYGSESMLGRAFYRRSQIAHQVFSFPNMSYGGYQMAQYLPFKVGGVNYANGVYTFDKSENVPLERFGFKFPTQMSFMGDNIFPQFIIFLLFNGLIVLVCVFVWRRNWHLGLFISVLYALCSLGLIFYINFADGTRMEGRDYDEWKKQVSMIVNDGASRVTVIPDPNALIDLRQNIERTKIRIETQRQRRAPEAQIKKLESELYAYEHSSDWVAWKKIEGVFAQRRWRAPFPTPVHMEVRERDYFYTPAFIFMSLIFGVGAGIFVLLLFMGRRRSMAVPLAAVLVLVSFAVPLASNYKEHNRSGLWVPWDYAYNLLNSCRPNAILFTNGDNDTFPLWFAQEVAGIRKDVRVVNLSLGNTDWYIKQMLDNEPKLKLSYDKKRIETDMVIDFSYGHNPEHEILTWVKRAQMYMPQYKSRIDALESQTLSPEDSVKLYTFKTKYQVWDAFSKWAERPPSGYMLTQHKLVIDLALQNMDRPIEISTTVGTSNFMGLEKYMVQEGLVYNFVKGDLTPKQNSFDAAYAANLIDSVYKFRGLGDGTAFINDETNRLLSSYVSLYLQISFDAREKIARLRTSRPFTQAKKDEVDSLSASAIKYLDLGKKQFPEEWRVYWAAAFIYDIVGEKQKALDVLAEGLKNVPEYDEGGRFRLTTSVEQIKLNPEMPMIIEDDAPAEENKDSAKDDSAPVVAAAQ